MTHSGRTGPGHTGPDRTGAPVATWLAVAALLAPILGGGGPVRAQPTDGQGPPGRAVLPEARQFAPLQREPGDIWAEIRSWSEGRGQRARTQDPAPEGGAAERRNAPRPTGCRPGAAGRACREAGRQWRPD